MNAALAFDGGRKTSLQWSPGSGVDEMECKSVRAKFESVCWAEEIPNDIILYTLKRSS